MSYTHEVTTVFDTLTVRAEGAVRFVEITARPMNLVGPELVRDLVAIIRVRLS